MWVLRLGRPSDLDEPIKIKDVLGDVAEREGFEPSIRFWRILTFQASAFDHSATAPHVLEGGA
jgi:hypothetical protein